MKKAAKTTEKTISVNYVVGETQLGQTLRVDFPNGSKIYVSEKGGFTITVPKKLCKKQLSDKKRKNIELNISVDEMKLLEKVMDKAYGKKETP